MIRLGLFGPGGRMGTEVRACVPELPELQLVASAGRETPAGVTFAECDVVVDFGVAAATDDLLRRLAPGGAALVSGVTGRDPAQEAALAERALRAPVLASANFSLGVALLQRLLAEAARALDWDLEIVETHHRRKADAPSGTALALARTAAEARGLRWPDPLVRHGETPGPRRAGSIGVAALRGGDVVGEHTVHLLGEGERLSLGHRATDRRIFARGALQAARWLAGRPPGRYGLADLIADPRRNAGI